MQSKIIILFYTSDCVFYCWEHYCYYKFRAQQSWPKIFGSFVFYIRAFQRIFFLSTINTEKQPYEKNWKMETRKVQNWNILVFCCWSVKGCIPGASLVDLWGAAGCEIKNKSSWVWKLWKYRWKRKRLPTTWWWVKDRSFDDELGCQ